MGAETVATLVVTAIVVVALAVYVLAIGLQLRRLSFTLGTILLGLRAIRMQTAPLGPVFEDLTEDVDALEAMLEEMANVAAPGQSAPAPPELPSAAAADQSAPEVGERPVGTSLVRSTGPARGRRVAPRGRRRTPADMRADIARAGRQMETT